MSVHFYIKIRIMPRLLYTEPFDVSNYVQYCSKFCGSYQTFFGLAMQKNCMCALTSAGFYIIFPKKQVLASIEINF